MSTKSERERRVRAEKQAAAEKHAEGPNVATMPKVATRGDEPTVAETQEEIAYLQWLLNEHGCPTTRKLICEAAVVVDVAHKSRHSAQPSEKVQSELTSALHSLAGFVATDSVVARGLATAQERASYYHGLTDRLLWLAERTSRQAMNAVDEVKGLTPPSLINMPTQSEATN